MYVTYIKSIKSNLINLKLSVNNLWDYVNKTWKLLDCKRPKSHFPNKRVYMYKKSQRDAAWQYVYL